MPFDLPSSEDAGHYRDDGCSFHPECLTCPLPQCRYYMGVKRQRPLERAWKIQQMEQDGLSISEMARQLEVTRRTIFRLKHYLDPDFGPRGTPLYFHRD